MSCHGKPNNDMKPILTTLTAIILAVTGYAQSSQTIGKLWDSFSKTEREDRPKDGLAILDKIKAEALKSRSGWDYFRACDRCRDLKIRINWKDRQVADDAFEKEIEDYADPAVVFYYRKFRKYASESSLKQYVLGQRSRLEKGHCKELYGNDHSITVSLYSEALLPLIENDWQYVLWSLFLGGANVSELDEIASGNYPLGAFVEYTRASRGIKSADMAAFVQKYSGKAAALLGRDWLLSSRFNELKKNVVKSSEPDFKSLREDCGTLIRDRKAFTGNEKLIAMCCKEADNIAGSLDAKSISVSSTTFDDIVLRLVNIPELGMTVSGSGKKVFEKKIKNPVGSYYVPDTVVVAIPAMDDGYYEAEFSYGGKKETASFSRHSLSLATREDASGFSVYVADSESGKPIDRCTIDLYSGSVLKDSIEGLPLDGFTLLPPSFSASLKESRGRMELKARCKGADGFQRMSRSMSVYSNSGYSDVGERNQKSALVLTDRRAFNPSDTLKFKVIAYQGFYEHKLRPAGLRLRAELSDAEGKPVGTCSLETGEFGSAAGSIALESGHRNGYWTLAIYEGSRMLASEGIRVDEFVLPTFSLTWDDDRCLHLTGDEITLSGLIQSYSGHSLSSAVITPTVRGADLPEEPRFELSEDGHFTLSFKTYEKEWGSSYSVCIRIADATGETLEFDNHVWAQSSIPLSPVLRNAVEGSFRLKSAGVREMGVVSADNAIVDLSIGSLVREGLKVKYTLTRDRALICSGEADAASTVSLDLRNQPSGLYMFEACAEEGARKAEFKGCLIKASDDDTSLDADVEWFFKNTGGEQIAVQAGATTGPVWIVAELFDGSRHLLGHKIVRLSGKKGASGSLQKIVFDRPVPDALVLKLFFFRDGHAREYTRIFDALPQSNELPLSFTRFLDTTLPGSHYTFTVKTAPDVECAAAVFDISTETIAPNRWHRVAPAARMPEVPRYMSYCGSAECYIFQPEIRMSSAKASSVARNASPGAVLTDAVALDEGEMVMAEPPMVYEESAKAMGMEEPEPRVRENFSSAAAWEPFLRSDKDGNVSFSFTNSDRLSTYAVQLFAHDRDFKNAALRREMVVTLPVKVSLVEPKVLRDGDLYDVRVTLSNSTLKDITGHCSVTVCKGEDKDARLRSFGGEVTVPAGGSAVFCPPAIAVQELDGDLGLLVSFEAGSVSDAVFVCVKVKPAVQTVTEAHSSLLKDGEDRDAIIASLRSQFVNVDGALAKIREISILDMLKEAVPEKVEPTSDNVLSLSEAYYANLLARSLGAPGLDDEGLSDIRSRILDCHNPDGGYAWFKGMSSSPVVTAVLLERLARMVRLDATLEGAFFQKEAVVYLDRTYPERSRPLWCGGLSMEQYLHVRSMYPEVEFNTGNYKAKELKEFRKDVKAYLVPSRVRGLNGQIFAKARRLSTLRNLLDGGSDLPKAWGIRLTSSLKKSVSADTRSLIQYAVEHSSGGCYYPNAVMPWRGLLESELYAHVVLCELLSGADEPSRGGEASSSVGEGAVAEGIRLWMMIQKETQSWGTDPAYLEALACVKSASRQTLATRVIALSADFTSLFEDIKAAGNGFTLERRYFREDGTPVAEGDTLNIGDKIRAEYRIWNGENRSFVRLSAPRPASFRPVQQLSGHYGWWLRPLYVNGFYSVTPQGYRTVLADCTEYWFDTYPEENTVISEEFFVSQSGRFHSPVPVIESLYAPHYRANGESTPMVSR